MENVIKLLILVTICSGSITTTTTAAAKGNQDNKEEKTIDNEYVLPNRNEELISTNHDRNSRKYPQYGRSGLNKINRPSHHISQGFNLRNDSFKRRNNESRSESTKKWKEENKKKNESREEEEFWRKADLEGRKSKAAIKSKKKEENFDSYNLRNLNSGQQHEEEKRSVNFNQFGFHLRDDFSDFSGNNRQRKMKKPGFIPMPSAKERKPNIILILTDDQDVELGSLNFMPNTLRRLRGEGAEFRHAYVTTPMCCPSRSSLLTGMYVHNHNVFTNNENCSNIQWQQTHETRTFATYLSNAGYRTGYFGKYLNKYNGSYIPPGWREWGGLIMNSRYYNYSINLNGKKIKHGWDYHKDYYTDLIANDSVAFLRQSKQYFSRKPVMLVVSFPAPHGPEDSAPQYSDMFFNVTSHHTPSYDYAPNPDKQWILQVTNKMQGIHKQFTDMLMTKRLQTLQSVDAAVEKIYQELKNIGELENTYIIYTSDHGYHLGQFGLVKGKSFPFEFDVRVPFLVRGPGVEPATVVDDIVLNIDLAPTFLNIAGVEPPVHMDGRSVLRLFHNRPPNKRGKLKWPDTFLIESSGRRDVPETTIEIKQQRRNKIRTKFPTLINKETAFTTVGPEENVTLDSTETSTLGVTEISETATKRDSSEESFETDADDDMDDDDDESDTENISQLNPDVPEVPEIPDLTHSDTQVDNKISPILQQFNPAVSKVARLAIECQRPDMQSPCRSGQKWHCVADGNRWRKHKCKFQRKCSCSTPTGFIYKKLENDERRSHKLLFGREDKRSKYLDIFRNKRSVDMMDVWENLSTSLDYSTLLSLMLRSDNVKTRRKRETDDHISAIVDDLERELTEAEETELTFNTTVTLGEEPSMSKCLVTSFGQVNCSRIVYNDFKVWKQSRDEIEKKIKNLKIELEALKEIRKHLKEKRPIIPIFATENPLANGSALDNGYKSGTTYGFVTTLRPNTDETPFTDKISTQGVEIEETTKDPSYDILGNGTGLMTEETTSENQSTTTESETTVKWRNGNKTKTNEDGSVNRIDNTLGAVTNGRDKCICRPDSHFLLTEKSEKELLKEARKRLKEERLKKRERKLRKKGKLEKECLSEKMNCFNHDNEHWRTPPLWTEGPFCFCMNANNNTYSCLRTINSTHNYLYCEFITGFKTYYNLRLDPFEQTNRISTLKQEETSYLSNQLAELKACKGARQCTLGNNKESLIYYNHNYNHNHNSRVNRDLFY